MVHPFKVMNSIYIRIYRYKRIESVIVKKGLSLSSEIFVEVIYI